MYGQCLCLAILSLPLHVYMVTFFVCHIFIVIVFTVELLCTIIVVFNPEIVAKNL